MTVYHSWFMSFMIFRSDKASIEDHPSTAPLLPGRQALWIDQDWWLFEWSRVAQLKLNMYHFWCFFFDRIYTRPIFSLEVDHGHLGDSRSMVIWGVPEVGNPQNGWLILESCSNHGWFWDATTLGTIHLIIWVCFRWFLTFLGNLKGRCKSISGDLGPANPRVSKFRGLASALNDHIIWQSFAIVICVFVASQLKTYIQLIIHWLVVWLPSILNFPINIGLHSSQLTFIFFRGVAQPPTSYTIVYNSVYRRLTMICNITHITRFLRERI